MTVPEIVSVVNVWAEEHAELGSLPYINYVQIFENRGEIMGCSKLNSSWPDLGQPDHSQRAQQGAGIATSVHGEVRCLPAGATICNWKRRPRRAWSSRTLTLRSSYPSGAVWPFEVLLVSKWHTSNIGSLNSLMREGLADIFKQLTTRYDNLFEVSFPYSMGFHQAPTDGEAHPEWHLHAHFYPPLLRSATTANLWLDTRCLPVRSGTLRRRRRPPPSGPV